MSKIDKIVVIKVLMLIMLLVSAGITLKNITTKGKIEDSSIKEKNNVEEIVNVNISIQETEQEVKEEEQIIIIEKKIYNDGVYSGEYKAIAVNCIVENGEIASIEITKNKQTPGYYEEVIRKIPKEIIEKQSIEVDGVTGCTSSSNNLKEAINKALEKAKIANK
ncbi:FMN-binding protein [Clostridium grantii]|uniref:FMN-binding domain-containing protein n=1 Tax=Clostridium grantii DSM 8605 TaxID=1121316 RepID=A0A1M5X157_9CLOT|nr:FMN-binding protein [Clostridium grantii]SHH93362.1 FMN-binding domain-containing protein [Clostridium grantii DSM 8605]